MRAGRTSVLIIAGFVGAALMVGDAVPAAELPSHLVSALEKDSTTEISFCSWSNFTGLPVVERLREIDEEGLDLQLLSMMLMPLLDTVDGLGLDDRHILSVWSLGSFMGMFPGALWLETGYDDAGLLEALAGAGWVDSEDQPQVFARPPEREPELSDIFGHMSEEELEQLIGGMTEEELEEMLRHAANNGPRLKPLGGGWLLVVPSYGSVPEDLPTGTVDTDSLELGFPFSELLSPPSSAVLGMAIDVPHNDGAFEQTWRTEADGDHEDGEETEADRLRGRLRQLRSAPERMLAGQLADFSIVVSESDGGLAVDVVARRPGGGGEEQNARFLEMLLLVCRFYFGAFSPQLDRELGDALIQADSGEVRARLVVSGATLIDTLEEQAARSREIRELRRRLDELEGS